MKKGSARMKEEAKESPAYERMEHRLMKAAGKDKSYGKKNK